MFSLTPFYFYHQTENGYEFSTINALNEYEAYLITKELTLSTGLYVNEKEAHEEIMCKILDC